MATQHLGNLPLDLKCHFSLHVGCTLVISHRYLRPGIEASFLLASAYTTSSRVLLRQHPSGPQLRRPVLSGGLCRQSGFLRNPLSCTCLVPRIVSHLACFSCNFLSPPPQFTWRKGGRVHAKAPRSYIFASLRAQTGRETWTPCFGRK